MLRAFTLLALTCAILPAQDAHEIVRRAVDLDKRTDEAWRSYNYVERQYQKQLDSSGGAKTETLRTFEVTFPEGSPYRKLIARNDQPLSADEVKAEEDKRQWNVEQRRKETKEQRDRRIGEWHKRQERQREPLQEIPDAFAFQITGSEAIGGVETWVIDAVPRPGYKPKSAYTSFLPKMKARL